MNFGRYLWNRIGVNRTSFKRLCHAAAKETKIEKPKTAIIMIYAGAPNCPEEVRCTLKRILLSKMLSYGHLDKDKRNRELIRILKKIQEKFHIAGDAGKSLNWIATQAHDVEKRLNLGCNPTSPHRCIIAYQFVRPSIYDALRKIQEMDSLENVIICPMYPQFSCGLTGSIYNTIYKFYKKCDAREGLNWIVADNLCHQESFINCVSLETQKLLFSLCKEKIDNPVVLFAARPMVTRVYEVGDFYPYHAGITMLAIMNHIGAHIRPFTLVWDGPFINETWCEPTAEKAIRDYVCKGYKNFLVVPISSAVQTVVQVYDYDVHLSKNVAQELGADIKILRVDTPNGSETYIKAVVENCLQAAKAASLPRHLKQVCPHCQMINCAKYRFWFQKRVTKPKC